MPIAPLAVAPYLEEYGYAAVDATSWRLSDLGKSPRPIFALKVVGHEEVDGHTMYTIECSLVLQTACRLDWQACRRLAQLREDLHDRVKDTLGDKYSKHFGQAPFASKGGLPGTTARLNAWFGALAACVNRLEASPSVVALALHFLDAPEPEVPGDEDEADGDDAVEATKPAAASKPPARVLYEHEAVDKDEIDMDFDLDLGGDGDGPAAAAPVARTVSRVEPDA